MAYRLLLAYDGTAFHGFQRQPRQVTVQGELEAALLRLTGRRAPVIGASRTDAGVHATGQVAVWAPLDCRIPPERLGQALNDALNPRIVVRSCTPVADDFDPRRAARAKTYVYRIWTGEAPSPQQARFVWWLAVPLNLPALDRLAQKFTGCHDFRAFRGEGSSARTTTRRIYAAGWTHVNGMWTFRVTGNGFLYHMVRMMVGAMVAEVAEGRAGLVESGLRHPEGPKVARPAPAQGLCLERVDY
jgi:tRNA pseudouridine38-40 synthase